MNEQVHEYVTPRPPFDASWVFSFLGRRAVPGVESVDGRCYRRRLETGGWLEVKAAGLRLEVLIPAGAAGQTQDYLARVKRLFDLDADSRSIEASLGRHPRLAGTVAKHPGLRVPGAWDPFELSVRAVLGQQVSVARATDLAVRLVDRYGEARGDGSLAFPTAERLVDQTPAEIGMPGARGRAISALSRAYLGGEVDFAADAEALRAALVAIPGIGPWTAEYITMRAGRDPDAFVASDWVILKRLGKTAAQARRMAEAWRPWRAYAVMFLWAEAMTDE